MSTYPHTTRPGTQPAEAALSEAATAALRAPSIFNTQPWRWRIHGDTAELRLDRSRQLRVVDPEGRLATISCGVALHHLRIALAAEGRQVQVVRLPEPADRDLLATVRVTGHRAPEPADMHHYQSTLIRHTDRRPFGVTPVPPETVQELGDAAEANGAHMYVIRPEDLPILIVAANRAAATETADPAYRAEINAWTHRPADAGDGVPSTTAVADVPRRVPVRDFALGGDPGLATGTDEDRGTTYAILSADGDGPTAWLQTGEALGAILVAAVEHGVSVSPMSDLVEVADTRATLRRLLSGIGEPMLVLRIGLAEPADAVPATPRRTPEDVIERIPQPGDQP